jgi:AmmeMemoRadiSam system protein B
MNNRLRNILKSITLTLAMSVAGITIPLMTACTSQDQTGPERVPVDTVGFAQYPWQLDSIIARTDRMQHENLIRAAGVLSDSAPLKVGISPHDDYSYAGYLYPALFQNVKSDVVILFGVGHRAKEFHIEDRIVFGSYRAWKSPSGSVKVSYLQDALMKKLPDDTYIVHDSLQTVEHSLEALIPFIEHYNPEAEIIPVIVPCMSFERTEEISGALAAAVKETMDAAKLEWGKGWSVVISTDAVHYGNEDWGGKNYDRFGVDSSGYKLATGYEEEIINTMLTGSLTPEKIKAFSSCTVRDDDYHEYKWTWCGRYTVPLGLLTCYRISQLEGITLTGVSAGYSTSIANSPIEVSDLGMGVTAPAKLTHWVGYAAVGYR